MNEFFDSIDFKLLRRQKALLLAIGETTDVAEDEAINGLINMIDDLQDMAHKAGYSGVFAESRNVNCLAGIKCPDCGNEDEFHIEVTVHTKFQDDGSLHEGDSDWSAMSKIDCPKCNLWGRVWQFQA